MPTSNEMRALSIAGPFAYLIATGWKSIELRSWKTSYRGLVLLHCSGGTGFDWIFDEPDAPSRQDCPKMAFIGAATLVDCIAYTNSQQWERDLEVHQWLGDEDYQEIRQHYYGGKPPIGHVFEDPILFDPPIMRVPGAFQYWKPKNQRQVEAFEYAWSYLDPALVS